VKFSDLIKTASSSMLRSKLRTFLTIIAIVIGAMTITLTNGIGTGIKSYLNKQIGNLGATNILLVQHKQPSDRLNTNNSGPALYNPNQKVSVTSLVVQALNKS
jgi:putative ABC transport system permease protein